MFYAILGIIVVVALFLIFRDDHDSSYNNSYNKKEKGTKEKGPKAEKKASGASLRDQLLGEIEAAIQDAKEGMKEPMSLVKEAMDEAKSAINSAMREAQKGWTTTGSPDIDEQMQPDPEEPDLSFLDTLDYDENLKENTETFDIWGLRYHCTVYDCGPIVGIVKPEPSNAHDPKAQAVIRADGKLLGYIPRTQMNWYEDFNEGLIPCPFVGKLEEDSSGLVAEIKVILPVSRDYVQEEIEQGL